MSKPISRAQENLISAMRHHDKSELVISHQDRAARITYPLRDGSTWSMSVPYRNAVALAKNADAVYCAVYRDGQGHYKLLAEPSVEVEF